MACSFYQHFYCNIHPTHPGHYKFMENETLKVKKTRIGKCVFAKKSFKKGEIVKEMVAQHLTYDQLPKPYDQVDDYYLQIGKRLYQGPAKGIDAYFNHSCNPNTGLKIKGKNAILIAIKNITKDQEITFDYSTSMDEDEWEMDCECDNSNCRKRIRDFKYLPKNIQGKYIKLDVVPKFVLNSLVQI